MRQTELVDSAAPGQASMLCHGWLHAPTCSNLVEQQKPWRPCLAGNPSRYNALETDGAPGEIRTPYPLVRSQVLYPDELRARGREL